MSTSTASLRAGRHGEQDQGTDDGQIVDEVAWAKNRTKSKVRAKVEHVFQVMKLQFGFVRVRYRGLKKNAHRLFVTCALVNLFVSRKKLLATV